MNAHRLAPARHTATRYRVRPFVLVALTGWFALASVARPALACPFCSAVSQTIRQEAEVMDAVLIAEATDKSVRDEQTGTVTLKVAKVLKGAEHLKGNEVTVVYYGDLFAGRRFLLSGIDPPNFQWSSMPLTADSEAYVIKMLGLPDEPLERLKFVQNYLQHPETMLNRDAYDEFATTPYPVIQSLKPFMDHGQLVEWIKDPEMPADRRRLYLTMLGVCGTEQDVPMLESLLTSPDPADRSGLDALIACYLLLAGEEGLQLVDDQFLNNAKAPYAETYSAVMAVRFHGTEADKIPRSTLVKSLYHVLERKDLADLVIPDLARWGDWSQIDRLVRLFMEAEADNNWVRVPVVNYLRACPKPEAEAALEKLREIDPESVRRASSFFAIPVPQTPEKPSTSFRLPKASGRLAAAGGPLVADYLFPIGFGGDDYAKLVAAHSPAVNPQRPLNVAILAIAMLMASFYLVLTGGGPRRAPATVKTGR